MAENNSANRNFVQKTLGNVSTNFFDANFTYRELLNLQINFREVWRTLENDGIFVEATFPDVKINKLVILIESELNDEIKQKIYNELGTSEGISIAQGGQSDLWNRKAKHRPMIGGVKVTTSALKEGTLGFTAYDSQGNTGIVISGHVVNGVGDWVWQADGDVSDHYIGDVTIDPSGNRYSDSAFVKSTQKMSGKIYSTISVGGVLSSTYQAVGFDVSMHGMESGITNGKIEYKNVDRSHPKYGTLYNQILASYPGQKGDSGGPITNRYSEDGDFHIYGIVVGETTYWLKKYAYYSPYDGIKTDLKIQRPLWKTETEN